MTVMRKGSLREMNPQTIITNSAVPPISMKLSNIFQLFVLVTSLLSQHQTTGTKLVTSC